MLWKKDNAKTPRDLAAYRVTQEPIDAAWGSKFRTARFGNSSDQGVSGSVYLQALRRFGIGTEKATWTIYRIRNQKIGAESAGAMEDREIEKKDLDFFSALYHLAEFENTQKTLGFAIVDSNEREALKFEHYQAFGRREGFIFDIHGLPHETENGEIITKGSFLESEKKVFASEYRPGLFRDVFKSRAQLGISARRITASDRTALWGSTFRTCHFDFSREVPDRKIYREAILLPEGKWSVFQVIDYNLLAGGTAQPASTRDKLVKDSGLFEALNFLAEWEMQQRKNFDMAEAPAEKMALGMAHYEAFGRREGYVFDSAGFPHETLAGQIVTKGDFLQEDINALAREIKIPKNNYEALFAQISNPEFITGLSSIQAKKEILFPMFASVEAAEKVCSDLRGKSYSANSFLSHMRNFCHYYNLLLLGRPDYYNWHHANHALTSACNDLGGFIDTEPLRAMIKAINIAYAMDEACLSIINFIDDGKVESERLKATVEKLLTDLKEMNVNVQSAQLEAALLERANVIREHQQTIKRDVANRIYRGGNEWLVQPCMTPLLQEMYDIGQRVQNDHLAQVREAEAACAKIKNDCQEQLKKFKADRSSPQNPSPKP